MALQSNAIGAFLGAMILGGLPIVFFGSFGEVESVVAVVASIAFTIFLWRAFLNVQLDGDKENGSDNLFEQPLEYRFASPDDAADCVALRGRTRENAISAERLRSLGITVESWGEEIRSGALPGFVCLSDGEMVGYCFGAKESGEIVVLALLPDFENRGIGSNLLSRVVAILRDHGRSRLFLGCSPDPNSRSYGFYRHLGWRSTGAFDKLGDEVLEYHVGTLQRE